MIAKNKNNFQVFKQIIISIKSNSLLKKSNNLFMSEISYLIGSKFQALRVT